MDLQAERGIDVCRRHCTYFGIGLESKVRHWECVTEGPLRPAVARGDLVFWVVSFLKGLTFGVDGVAGCEFAGRR